MNREEVLKIVREARDRGKTPDMHGADLSGADLYEADLHGANLYGVDLLKANLHGANLRWADLRRANLSGVNLRKVNLRGANLSGANLSGADLRKVNLRGAKLYGADLREAYLRGADLYGADLRKADLSGANLRWAKLYEADLREAYLRGADLRKADLCGGLWDGLCIDGIHHYRCLLVPTPDGWTVTIGCWSGTVTQLRCLIASDDGWPEATGDQISERRPLLSAFCDLCDVHMAAHPGVIDDLAARWSA